MLFFIFYLISASAFMMIAFLCMIQVCVTVQTQTCIANTVRIFSFFLKIGEIKNMDRPLPSTAFTSADETSPSISVIYISSGLIPLHRLSGLSPERYAITTSSQISKKRHQPKWLMSYFLNIHLCYIFMMTSSTNPAFTKSHTS